MGGDAGGDVVLRRDVVVDELDLNGTHESVRAATSASDPTKKRGRPIKEASAKAQTNRPSSTRLSLTICMSIINLLYSVGRHRTLLDVRVNINLHFTSARVYLWI